MYDEIKMTLQVNSKKTQQFWKKKKNIYIYTYIWTLRKKPLSSAWVTLQPREIADAF